MDLMHSAYTSKAIDRVQSGEEGRVGKRDHFECGKRRSILGVYKDLQSDGT